MRGKCTSPDNEKDTAWVRAGDRLPTEEDGDSDQEIYWCGEKFVRRERVREVLSWDFSKAWNFNGHWRKTGIVYPKPPNYADK